MSIRYKSLTALDYKTMSIGNDILCANLKERIRKQEALVDKNTNLALSFENAMGKKKKNFTNLHHLFMLLLLLLFFF